MTRVSVPHFASAIVRPGDELVSSFVKGAISQGKQMRSEHLLEAKALLLVLLLLFDELLDQFLQLGLLVLRNERLFKENLVDQAVNISPIE